MSFFAGRTAIEQQYYKKLEFYEDSLNKVLASIAEEYRAMRTNPFLTRKQIANSREFEALEAEKVRQLSALYCADLIAERDQKIKEFETEFRKRTFVRPPQPSTTTNTADLQDL